MLPLIVAARHIILAHRVLNLDHTVNLAIVSGLVMVVVAFVDLFPS